ncbi:MAG: bifunctional homocysteine S-methyltransferase/methylenetetrahydrofolate reductase [Bacteroidota bacterium]
MDISSWLETARTRVLIADGAMGTELHRLGVPYGTNLDRACLTHPALVAETYRGYLAAGAKLIETNTVGAHPVRLARAGLAGELEAINRAAVRLAREAAGGAAAVAGAIGPLGGALAPLGDLAREEAAAAFAAQAAVLAGEGVDLLLLETFADLDELRTAVEAVVGCGLPIVASLAFDAEGYTAAGVAARTAGAALARLPLAGFGANCGAGPDGLVRAAEELAPYLRPEQLFCLMPNAGLPRRQDGRTIFPNHPGYFAEAAKRLAACGANIIGGCCGTGPAHIAALTAAVGGRPVAARPAGTGADPPLPAEGKPRRAPFLEKLGRRFVCTVELDPPKGPDPAALIQAARAVKSAGADAVNIADGPMARVRMGSIALAHRLQEEAGIEVLLHLTCRDRNLIGLQADLLGAAALGVRNILALTGDPPGVGDHPQAKPVFDVNAAGLVRIMAGLNRGTDLAGNALGRPTEFAIGVAFNPSAEDGEAELARLAAKVEAGADFILTQPVFDPRAAEPRLRAASELGLPLMLGLWPLRSLRQAEYLAHEVPGVEIPPALLEQMRACAPERQGEAGLAAARETMAALRPLCAGACLMTGGSLPSALALLRAIRGVTT